MEEIKCTREDIEKSAEWFFKFWMFYDMIEKGMISEDKAGTYYERETEKLTDVQQHLLDIMMETMRNSMKELSEDRLKKKKASSKFFNRK